MTVRPICQRRRPSGATDQREWRVGDRDGAHDRQQLAAVEHRSSRGVLKEALPVVERESPPVLVADIHIRIGDANHPFVERHRSKRHWRADAENRARSATLRAIAKVGAIWACRVEHRNDEFAGCPRSTSQARVITGATRATVVRHGDFPERERMGRLP